MICALPFCVSVHLVLCLVNMNFALASNFGCVVNNGFLDTVAYFVAYEADYFSAVFFSELSFENREKVPLEASEGLIAAEYVYFYPPGIPLLVPGEVIEESVIHQIKSAKQNGIEIYGGCDGNGIFVCTHR